ncbi:MAG: excinuclease ABC subunit UvrC [candidate division Zixibacteria bacterium]
MNNVDLEVKLINLPEKPGCYLFKNSENQVLYIGKAGSLKKRVRSYFQKRRQDPKTEKLVSHITDVDILVTPSEKEALILESNLIKEHKPRYNIDLKDDKRYPYIKITSETYPRMLVVRRVLDDNAKYFGPYTNSTAMRRTIRLIRRIFTIRSCSLELPSKRKYRVCLDYFIDRCPGCCEPDKTTPEAYNGMISEVIMFLSGRSHEIADRLKIRMNEFSDALKYEQAARVRDQLKAIESVIEKQRVVSADLIDRDVVNIAAEGNDACVSLLKVRRGVLLGQESYIVTTAGFDNPEVIRVFLPRYYKSAMVFPSEIIVPVDFTDFELMTEYLREKADGKLRLFIAQKGEKAALLKIASDNARHNLDLFLAEKSANKKRAPHAVYSLFRDLYLKKLPRTIAACDISNLGKDHAVGSVVFFADAQPRKSGYRRMKINSVKGQDDFAMMNELVGRYFVHLAENQKDYPDLLLIDGGKGQLNAALRAIRDLNIDDQQVVSLAKRFEEVYLPGRSEPLSIPKSSSSIKLLQRIRDEAHRFAVTYHRALRSKKIRDSELDRIPGVGKARKLNLLAAFGSVEGIRKASLDDLLAVPHIHRKLAEDIRKYFNQESDSE